MNWILSSARKIRTFACLAITILFVAPTYAQTSKLLLGIPFGSKLQLFQCPSDTQKSKKPCWIDKPFFYKPTGTTLGYVFLPDPNSRPKWAAYAMFSLMLDKTGIVQEIKVNTFDPAERFEIAQSISGRFGKPTDDRLKSVDVKTAYWSTSEGIAQILCSNECWVEFRTPAAQAARDAEHSAKQNADVARPKTP